MAQVQSIGVLGGGVMGSGIAQAGALAGLRVTVVEATSELAARAQENLERGRFGLARGVERGKIDDAEAEAAKTRLSYSPEKSSLADCDLLIEAVSEDKGLKQKLLGELDEICPEKTIFATNTSGFCVTELSESLGRKDRFLGMHFFSPVPVMKPVEIIYTPQTSEESLAAAEYLAKQMGKVSIRVKDVPGTYGFVANRVYLAMLKEAQAVLAEGVASREDIDTVMRLGYNWPVGPFAMIEGATSGWKK